MPEQNTLSEREIEILQLVATGLTNREIAQKLTISPNTVKVHLSNIFEKINVSSRTEATMFGIEHGIVDVPGVENAEPVLNWKDLVRKNISTIMPLFLIALALIAALWRTVLFPPAAPAQMTLEDIPDRWQELAPMPEARMSMAAVAYDGNIFAIAGEGLEGVSGSVFKYLVAEDRWERLHDKPTPVTDVEGAVIGEKIYIPGGRLRDGRPTDILEIYDPRQDSWREGAPLPKEISAYAMADFEGKLYLFGGWDGENSLTDVYVYDPEENAWGVGTPMAMARQHAGAIALADKIVVLGGRNGEEILNEANIYFASRDLIGENPWEEFVQLPEELHEFGLANTSDSIFLFGGVQKEDGNEFNLLTIRLEDQTWQDLMIDVEDSFLQPVLVSSGLKVYVFSSAANGIKTNFWAYQAYYNEIYLPIVD